MNMLKRIRRNQHILAIFMIHAGMFLSCKAPDTEKGQSLQATHYFSGFEDAHDTYNAVSTASDGKIYYVLSSAAYDKGGQIYKYDPLNDKVTFLGDLTDICGEKGKMTISQGKSHVDFYERDGKLYFATHVGYYEMIDGMERLPVNAPEGYQLYTGGIFSAMT